MRQGGSLAAVAVALLFDPANAMLIVGRGMAEQVVRFGKQISDLNALRQRLGEQMGDLAIGVAGNSEALRQGGIGQIQLRLCVLAKVRFGLGDRLLADPAHRAHEVADRAESLERVGVRVKGSRRVVLAERAGDALRKVPFDGHRRDRLDVVVRELLAFRRKEGGWRKILRFVERGVFGPERLHEKQDAAILQQADQEGFICERPDHLGCNRPCQARTQHRLLPEALEVERAVAQPVEVSHELKAERVHADPAQSQERDGPLDSGHGLALRVMHGVGHLEQPRRHRGIRLDHGGELGRGGPGGLGQAQDLDRDGGIRGDLRLVEDRPQLSQKR